MDQPLITWQGAYEIPDNVSRLGAAVEGSNIPKRHYFVPIKFLGDPPLAEASFSSRSVHMPFSASLSQSTHSLVWISDLVSMASTCSQPIAYSYPHISIIESGFQFLRPLPSSDASLFGCAAHFNLSTTDVPASMNSRCFQASPAVG
jgi:hypothetical protein